MVYERDMARRVASFYPSHQLIDMQALREMGSFTAIAPPDFEADLRIVLSDFWVIRREPDVYEVSLRH